MIFKSSKEEIISERTNEVNEDAVADQIVPTTGNVEIVSSKPIATSNKSETKLRNHVAIEKNQK